MHLKEASTTLPETPETPESRAGSRRLFSFVQKTRHAMTGILAGAAIVSSASGEEPRRSFSVVPESRITEPPPPPLELLNGGPVQVQSMHEQEPPPHISIVTGVMFQKLEEAKAVRLMCSTENRKPTAEEAKLLKEADDMQQGVLAIKFLEADAALKDARDRMKQDPNGRTEYKKALKEFSDAKKRLSRATGVPNMLILRPLVEDRLAQSTKENADQANADLHPHSHINDVVVRRSLEEMIAVDDWLKKEEDRLKTLEQIAVEDPPILQPETLKAATEK